MNIVTKIHTTRLIVGDESADAALAGSHMRYAIDHKVTSARQPLPRGRGMRVPAFCAGLSRNRYR